MTTGIPHGPLSSDDYTKRRWALHYATDHSGWVPWASVTFTARGYQKALRKLMRKLDRRPGVALMIENQLNAFSLRICE